MKKRGWFYLLMIVVFLAGCGKREDMPVEKTAAETDGNSAAFEQEKTRADKKGTETEELTEEVEEASAEPRYIAIDLSETEEMHREGDAVAPLELRVISEEENGIDEADGWYDRNQLSLPMIGDSWDHFYDEEYEYQWIGEELFIYEKESGSCIYILSYPTDRWYVNGNNAYLKDGIFYGGSVRNGYAEPGSCFMFAYDLNKDELLWRSADQSYNTMNFLVKGDVIICGYGFTEEKDYLYQINRNTGKIIGSMELKKMPDLLAEQDGKLYVHTYSYDYVMEMDEPSGED